MFLLKVLDKQRYRSKIFRLHSSKTVSLLIICALLTGFKLLFSPNPVNCIPSDQSEIENEPNQLNSAILNLIGFNCLSNSTINILLDESSNDSIYLDVIARSSLKVKLPEINYSYQNYYFISPVLLLIQAFFFLLPSIIWIICESGFTKQMKNISRLENDDSTSEIPNTLSSFLGYQSARDSYAIAYYSCEFLSLINIVCQIIFTDYYLGGYYLSYGFDVIKYLARSSSPKTDPKALIFPTKTTCSFRSFYLNNSDESPFKSVINEKTKESSIICGLELNVINREIYLLIWFWFAFLLVASFFILFYRLMVLLAYKWRGRFLNFSESIAPLGYLNYICKDSIGNFFILSICQSFDIIDISTILKELGEELEENSKTAYLEV